MSSRHGSEGLARSRAPSRRSNRPRVAFKRTVLPGQVSFAFLQALPVVERSAQRAFRPHLRGRTSLAGEQFVLPLRSPPGAPRYRGIEACEVEDAVRAARAGEPAAVGRLVELTRPEVREVARSLAGPRCALSVDELVAVAEARLVELQAWLRFEPGRARGRTLWPAYARRLARQAMATALENEGPVHVTRWARRRRAALEARAEAEGRTLEEVLAESPEGGAAAAVLELPHAAPLEAARHVQENAEGREDRSQQALAVIYLSRLPVRERVAVAGPLGLLREGVVGDRKLALHLRTTIDGVRQLREQGLRHLRAILQEG